MVEMKVCSCAFLIVPLAQLPDHLLRALVAQLLVRASRDPVQCSMGNASMRASIFASIRV